MLRSGVLHVLMCGGVVFGSCGEDGSLCSDAVVFGVAVVVREVRRGRAEVGSVLVGFGSCGVDVLFWWGM